MQKLDLRNNLKTIIDQLKTVEILETFSTREVPSSTIVAELFIESKAGYDKLMNNAASQNIISDIISGNIYQSDIFTQIIQAVLSLSIDARRSHYLSLDLINQFYNFHRSLKKAFILVDSHLIDDRSLFDNENQFSYDEALNNGNLLLQLSIDDDVSLDRVAKMFTGCQDLIEIVYSYIEETNQNIKLESPKVSLIDSGSDININIKIPEFAAKIISKLLIEFWELFSSNENYKLKKKTEAIGNSLSIIKEIKNAQDENIIDNETALRLKHGIIQHTESIVFKGLLPKEIAVKNMNISNRDLLLEKTKTLLLEENIEPKEYQNN